MSKGLENIRGNINKLSFIFKYIVINNKQVYEF